MNDTVVGGSRAWWTWLAVTMLGAATGLAGSATYNFNMNPAGSGLVLFGFPGSFPEWRSSGGASGAAADGYLALFDAVGGQEAAILFPNFDNNLIVQGFTFDVDLRVGNPVGNGGRPADGFSLNYARITDPVVLDLIQNPPIDPVNDYAMPGQPENGIGSGIAISFDTWQGNVINDVGSDIEGLIVRVDNQTIVELGMPDRNGVNDADPTGQLACTDPNSIQTGPYDGLDTGNPAGLCWAHLHVELTTNSLLTVQWKGTNLLDHQQVNFTTGPGRLLFAGRTGGANENTHIDNVSITTIAAAGPPDTTPPVVATLDPLAGALVPALTQIEVIFSENVANVQAAALLVNGQAATNVAAMSGADYIFLFPQPATGTVQVAWSPTNTIQDLAVPPNAFAGSGWAYTLDPRLAITGVTINEIMADNKKTLRDEDGDSSDWIELYNAGTSTVNLNGWFLSDDATRLPRWRFPAVTLLANQYLVVFASGKDRTNPAAPLHTDFTLAKTGGYVALSDAQTNVVSAFSFPAQTADVSYGRDRSSPTLLEYFPTPTPGAANAAGGPGYAPDVEFSQSGCTFVSPFALTLTTPVANAVIHYELGTNLPTASSAVFTNALLITNSVQVRARAFLAGFLPGAPRSESYIALSPNVTNFTSNLPLMVIYNFKGGPIPAGTRKFANLSVFEPGAGRSSLTNPPVMSLRGGFSLHGSSTLYQPKSNFRVVLWDEFGDDQSQPLLGLPADPDWILYAPDNFEPVLIHNPFIHNLSRSIGRYSSRVRLVEVFLNTTGGPLTSANYNGVYVLEEKIKISPDRVDIDKLQPEQTTPPLVTGGYLLGIDRSAPGEGQIYAGGQGINALNPKYDELMQPQRAAQWNYINKDLNSFYTTLESAGFADPVNGYAQFMDVDSWIDHHMLNTLAFNVDALRLSAFFYKPRNGKLTFGPLWDFDRALGSTDGRDNNPRVWSTPDGSGTDMFHYPWWDRLFTDIDFWQQWIDRWQGLRQAQFSLTNLNAQVDYLTGQLIEAQKREAARWPGFTTPRGGSYQWEITHLKSWLSNRVNFIDTNFLVAPTLTQTNGFFLGSRQITLAGPANAALFFTLDGSDPRLSGGGVSPRAVRYQEPITVTANARLVARAFDSSHRNLTGASVNPPLSSPWSGPVAVTLAFTTPALRITEIMYNDVPPPAGDTNAVENFSYLELQNTGTTPLNLIGFSLSGGIQYTFTAASGVTNLPAGGFVLVVKNRGSFLSRHPGVTNIAGEYTGSLNNGGDHLVLTGPLQEPILDFSYDNTCYPITDGLGFSLVVTDPTAPTTAWSTAAGWRVSSEWHGSPGVGDPAPPVFPEILVNEALAHPATGEQDSIELFNPDATPASVGGWFVTDNFQDPFKYRIPANTVIPANGFLVLTAKQFGAGTNGFGLSRLGDSAHLFSGDGTNLTGYTHGFKFGASLKGVSFGRLVTSDGLEHFAAQIKPTFGAPNAGPQVGPVVINELMYNPPPLGTNNDTLDEFVELRNITTQAVPLYDPAAATNTWELGDGISFTFPPNVSLPAGGYVLIVNFDPVSSPVQLALFRAKYNVDPSVPIFGPYGGNLANQGETVGLYQPTTPEGATDPQPGQVPYVLVDQVTYANQAPWPTNADGTGLSLQRITGTVYGDEPANWQATAPTAGSDNPAPPLGSLSFDAVAVTNGVTHLTFSMVAGHSYTVQVRTDLGVGDWLKLTDIAAPAVSGETEVTDPASGPARFYRLVSPAQP